MKSTTKPLLHKGIAGILLAALIIGTYSALHSLYLSPEQGKFIYNNLANTLGISSAILVFVLSALQKDVYWISRKRTVSFDERQIKERQEVFEISYKIGAILVLASVLFLFGHRYNLPVIIDGSRPFDTVPSALFWPFFNLAITMFALPLMVAAYKQKQ